MTHERAAAPGVSTEGGAEITDEEITSNATPRLIAGAIDDLPTVLHRLRGLSHRTADELATAGYAVQARCGELRVPRRPPYPADAVLCPLCEALSVDPDTGDGT